VSDAVFRRTRKVEARHIDHLGHVNNAVWLRFVVGLADAHSTALGFDFERLRALGGLWIVRRHEIDYDAPAFEGDELLEETWVEQMKGARSVRACRFTRPRDGALLLRARTTWAYCDSSSQRPRRIPPEILAAFTPIPPPALPPEPAGP
jgi:acyl-CoA thioester hydrolase